MSEKFYDKLILKVLKNGLDINKKGINILKKENINLLLKKLK